MKQLPTEIWLEILKLLPEQDKLTCLLVSKFWNKSIRPYLLNHAKIQNDLDLADAIFYFETYPELANNVLHLEIRMCENIILSLPLIQHLFRNLEKLTWFSDKELQITRYPPLYFWVHDPWSDLKELRISETLSYDECSLFELILRRGLCPNLRKLSLEILDIVREGNRFASNVERCASSVEMMANAPHLSHLEITSFEGSLKLFDFLHKKLPKLNSLKLHNLRLHDYSVPLGSLETVQLTDLHLEPGMSINPLLLFDYIVSKYTGLVSFRISLNCATSSVSHGLAAAEQERTILPLFSRCPKLTYYDQCYLKFTPTIAYEMDLCGIQLKTIKLYVDRQTVKSQCAALGDSNQRKFVNHVILRLLNMIPEENQTFDQTLDAQIIPQALEPLANLTNMTKLTLQSNDNLLCFKEFPIFLNKLPQLLTLSIQDMALTTIYDNYVDELTTLSLKSIEICSLKTSSTSFAVSALLKKLLQSCPDLQEFLLHFSLDEDSNDILESVTLDFRNNHKLKTIDIDSKGDKSQYLITHNNPASSICYLHDKKKDLLLVASNDFVSKKYYTAIILSQPVLLNSHRV